MKLAKLHGLGNDFLVVEAQAADPAGLSFGSLARNLCRRHSGIGADGILFYQATSGDAEADVSALIFNADGSRAEMSGNGTRCLAAYLAHCGKIQSPMIRIRTVSGIRVFALKGRENRTYTFENSMGIPEIRPDKIPVRHGSACEALIDFPLDLGSEALRVTVCSMGNPHCSTFWPDVDEAPVQTLGPELERHALFPNRTNVEFIQVRDRHCLRVRFWERGVGATMSSGTGSSAAAVAAILNRLVESPVTVEVEGGSLLVQWQPPAELLLTGPAEYICSIDCPIEASP
jgi:diaminopimelate epimerase